MFACGWESGGAIKTLAKLALSLSLECVCSAYLFMNNFWPNYYLKAARRNHRTRSHTYIMRRCKRGREVCGANARGCFAEKCTPRITFAQWRAAAHQRFTSHAPTPSANERAPAANFPQHLRAHTRDIPPAVNTNTYI